MNETVKEKEEMMNYKKTTRQNQLAYIIQAALEYFVSLLVSGAFLASILKNIGVPDAVTGVISTLTSLGISAQLVAVLFIRPRGSVKKMVTIMHFINQIMFTILYLIPYINVPHIVKITVFVIMFLGGHLIMNSVTPFRLSWLMSYVPDNERGNFTANKEIISLLTGIVFTYTMGAVIDHYDAIGRSETGFVISGLTLFGLCILHLISLLCVKEIPETNANATPKGKKHTVKSVLGITLFDKNFKKIILLDVLWHFGTGLTGGFYSTYQINELNFSLKYVAILTAMSSFVRVAFSKYFGKLADRYSWAKMLTFSFIIGACAFLVNIFTTPANGMILFAVYYVIHGIYMAGSNSGMMNIVFDYVSHEDRPYALGVKSALGGIVGFLASLLGAEIVSTVQANGNIVLGKTIYAQQILSLITFILFVIVVVFINKVILKMKKIEK